MSILAIVLIASALLTASLIVWLPEALHRHGNWFTADALFRIELCVITIFILILAGMIGWTTGASFVASASTELITVQIRPQDMAGQYIRWPKPDRLAGIAENFPDRCQAESFKFKTGGPDAVIAKFEVLYPSLPVPTVRTPEHDMLMQIALDRASSGIRVILDGGHHSVGTLTCNDRREVPAPRTLRLEYDVQPGQKSPTLAVNGIFSIGGSVGDSPETDPSRESRLLLSGLLSVEAEALLGSGHSRTEAPLQLGDIVTFANSDHDAVATGFVRADHNALAIMAYADAERALVARGRIMHRIPIAYSPSLWARIEAMSEWNAIILLGGLALAVLSAVRRHLSVLENVIVSERK